MLNKAICARLSIQDTFAAVGAAAAADTHFYNADLWRFFNNIFPKQGHVLLLLVIEKQCVYRMYACVCEWVHLNASPKLFMHAVSVSYRIDGKVANTHLNKNLYVRFRTFILMSFSPFHLSFHLMFVPPFCHSVEIHFRFFSLPFLFFRSHIIITVTRCLFILFSFHSFPTAAIRLVFTFYFFMCAYFIAVFSIFLSLSLLAYE